MWWNKKRRIYLDYAAASPIDARVSAVMEKYFTRDFFNPSALYQESVSVRNDIESMRGDIAQILGVRSQDIIFTNGGTESNNLALRGIVESWHAEHLHSPKLPEVIISAIEHKAVRAVAEYLEKRNLIKLRIVPVDEYGVIRLDELEKALSQNTLLVSCMLVNNEIGTVQPVRDIAKSIRKHKKHTLQNTQATFPLFHVDAIQAPHIMKVALPQVGCDLLTLSSAKIGGPKAIGILAMKKNILLVPLVFGGGQEKGLRSGTENVPYIAGMHRALLLADEEQEDTVKHLIMLRTTMSKLVQKGARELQKKYSLEYLPYEIIQGTNSTQAPHILTLRMQDLSGEQVVIEMDARGVCISSQSACSVASQDVPDIVRALELQPDTGIVRFSFHRTTTVREIQNAYKHFESVIDKLLHTRKHIA